MYPIIFTVGFDGTTYSSLYCGSSLDAARTALANAVESTALVGWVFEDPHPVMTLRGTPVVSATESLPPEVLHPSVLDVESAIGLERLEDGRTVIAGDYTHSEELPKDESGKQLAAAEREMTADDRAQRHQFAVAGLKESRDMVRKDQESFEVAYAEPRGEAPRPLESYTESSHIAKQRKAEAERSESAHCS